MSRDAVIVSTARTPIGRAYKGGFNATPAPRSDLFHSTLLSSARASTLPRLTTWSGALSSTQGTQAGNIGRQVALRGGAPVTVAAQTIDRQCSSGLMAIATAAKQVVVDNMDIVVGGGQDSISLVQTPEMRVAPRSVADRDAQGRLHADARHGRDRRGPLWHQAAKRRTNMRCNRRCAPLQARKLAISMPRSSRSLRP